MSRRAPAGAREVYALGHTAPSQLADVVAAVLACGAGAAASHRSAAHMLMLLPVQPRRPEVTVPTAAGRARPGIVVRRVANLDPRDVKRVHRIPTTTPARTLLVSMDAWGWPSCVASVAG